MRSQPLKEIPAGLVTVPSTATNYTTTATWVHQIIASNKTNAAVTLTVTDRQTSAKTLVPTVSIDANGQYSFWCSDGVCLLGGMNWVASSADAIDAEVFGYVANS